ncbi:MAG: 16S rRNA (guanine(527)-N(7))-methyltransferase RsmG [Clostridiales bacterium]|jgi:16S rRNA (guanine527-N7)-methyltransferase|nr:16S rRNA (guanine(527)-N(7))-methyltransferase RsmG [Clostridiales bacterium]
MRKDIVAAWASANGVAITDAQFAALAAYQERVLEVNQHMNLTAITDPKDFAVKHIIDSLTLLSYLREGTSVIDIGTGAGFPGLVLRIMRDGIKLTLLDSLRKRIIFLRETSDMLGFSDVECIHARAEEWKLSYDICTARAVASLDKLAKYALPLVKKGGLFLAMKGYDVEGEIEKAKTSLKKFGGSVEKIVITEIEDGLRHSIVVIRKA